MVVSKIRFVNNLTNRQWVIGVGIVSAVLFLAMFFLHKEGIMQTPWVIREKLNAMGLRNSAEPLWNALKTLFALGPIVAVVLYVALERVCRTYEDHRKVAIEKSQSFVNPEKNWVKLYPAPFGVRWGKRLLTLLLVAFILGGLRTPFSHYYVNFVKGYEYADDLVNPEIAMAEVYDVYWVKDVSKTLEAIRASVDEKGNIPAGRGKEFDPIEATLNKNVNLTAELSENGEVTIQGEFLEGYEGVVVFTRLVLEDDTGVHTMNVRTYKPITKDLVNRGEFVLGNLERDGLGAHAGPGEVSEFLNWGRARYAAKYIQENF